LKKYKAKSAHFTSTSKAKDNSKKRKKDKEATDIAPQKKQQKISNDP